MISFKSVGAGRENICFQELGKFSFLTLLSVAGHSGSDHFQELSTDKLTRICFEELTGPIKDKTRTLWLQTSLWHLRTTFLPQGVCPLTFPKKTYLGFTTYMPARQTWLNSWNTAPLRFFIFLSRHFDYFFYILDHDSQ